MKVIAVIPARLASTRLARKVLLPIAGQPMLARVYQGVRAAAALSDVIVATDADEILDLCRERGWHARLTSASCRSGTERVHEVAQEVPAEVYINVQGDEPWPGLSTSTPSSNSCRRPPCRSARSRLPARHPTSTILMP